MLTALRVVLTCRLLGAWQQSWQRILAKCLAVVAFLRNFALAKTEMHTYSIQMLCINDHIADLSEEQIEKLINFLPEWRREQALRFRHLQGRKECAVGYIELLRGLREQFGIKEKPTFAYNEHGKPFLPEHPDIHFSISHCKEAAICVISDRPVGVDVESVRSFNDSLVHYTMNEDEIREIEAAEDSAAAFIRLWTKKEAALKLEGTGISKDMKQVLHQKELDFETFIDSQRRYVYSVCQFYT